MNILNNKLSLFALFSLVLGFSAVAKEYTYKGRVEGMVCAFCTYNVGKKIAEYEGVDAPTVNLDLKLGEVGFVSTLPVDKTKLAQLFADTGFKLVSLNEAKTSQLAELKFKDKALITINFSANKLSEFEDILDALGAIAASETTQLSVTAPKNIELDVLKPIIAGRQRAIKVNFEAASNDEVNIKLSTTL